VIHTDSLPSPGSTTVIEASAGTGKTWTISTLAVRFLAETDIKISQMAIVTFTVASTAEVKQRTQQRLTETAQALSLAEAPTDGSDLGLWCEDTQERELRRTRLLYAVEDFDLAPIMTTHGFCDRLLCLLGILADHDIYDQLVPDVSEFSDEAIADHYLRLTTQENPGFSYTAARAWAKEALLAPSATIYPPDSSQAQLVDFVRRSVESRKRRRGVYTFDDMLLRCRDALREDTHGVVSQRLSQTYPLLLVDEFQDTDLIQWEIIRTGFIDKSTVILIGDPKQSIYGFRGAQVSAYLKATEISAPKTLDTNYRSSPDVVQAVGALMDGAELGDPRIVVKPVLTSTDTPSLMTTQPWSNPIRLRIPADFEPRTAEKVRELIDSDLVEDLIHLLGSKTMYRKDPSSDPQPLRPQDIAIIVSTNKRGNAIMEHLLARGVPGVFTGTGSVFDTQAAQDWLRLLRAIESGHLPQMRVASLTTLIGWDLNRLVQADVDEFSDLVAMIRHLGTLMNTSTVMSVLDWLVDHTDLRDRLSRDVVGERSFMDLTQLAQLLSQPHGDFQSPTEWLLSKIRSSSTRNDSARRLPTHADAVRILTVHQAKGLQFPVVYLPQVADQFDRSDLDTPIVAHDADGERVLDLGISKTPSEIRRQAFLESAHESLRACYVALTRSSAHITMWWIPSKRTIESSALHRLLFRRSPTPPVSIPVNECDPRTLNLPGIVVETIPDQPEIPRQYSPQDSSTSPEARPHQVRPHLTRDIDQSWRRTSFSSLTANSHHYGPDIDEPSESQEVGANTDADSDLDQVSPMADLPGGTAFGSLVHSVFEYWDPANDLADVISSTMNTSGLLGFTVEDLTTALAPGLATPLGEIADNLTLAQIPLRDRLAELDFELPLSHGQEATTLNGIAKVLTRHLPPDSPLVSYPSLLSNDCDPRALRGYLTGSIDAVLRVNGRFLIADYKTNRLSSPQTPLTLRHYTLPAMAQAMMSSHYPLQALIYSVALHRFLRWRIPDYDPDRHLGGIAYLFVRGMAGPDTPVRHGTPCGVFSWKPSSDLIEELSDLFSGVRS
jgi:exodeoxyribonuclease V beta subunit